jgi:hypothetical protein
MATTTEIPTIHSVPPPVNGSTTATEPKRPRGRPQKCRQCGENIDPTKAHVCATPPPVAEEASGDEDFWITISNFTPEEWNHLTAYLYRVMPRIDRKANGKPINLGCYSTAFTRDDIMQEHGSGVYRIDVTQTEQASSRSRRIAREVFTIINPKYPPIVPPGDWVDDKVNDMWKWGAPPGAQSSAGIAAGYPPGFNWEAVADRTEKGLKMGLEMAKAMTPPPPPAKDDSALLTLVTELIRNRPEPAKPDDTATKALLAFLERQNDRLSAEIKEMRTAQLNPSQQPGNILTQVRELRPVLTEFVEIFAQKNGGDQPWWAAPLEKLMDGVGEAIPGVIDLMKTGQQQQQRSQAAQWNPGAPAAIPAPQTNMGPTPQPQTVNVTGNPAPPPPPPTDLSPEQREMQEIQNLYQKWGGFILFISPQMIEHFKTETGQAFRDWFLRGHGLFRWADLRRELGPDLLCSMIAQHPALSQEMSPAEAREQFIKGFFEPVSEEDDDDDPDDGVISIGGEAA